MHLGCPVTWGNRRLATGDWRQETGDRRQEARVRAMRDTLVPGNWQLVTDHFPSPRRAQENPRRLMTTRAPVPWRRMIEKSVFAVGAGDDGVRRNTGRCGFVGGVGVGKSRIVHALLRRGVAGHDFEFSNRRILGSNRFVLEVRTRGGQFHGADATCGIEFSRRTGGLVPCAFFILEPVAILLIGNFLIPKNKTQVL